MMTAAKNISAKGIDLQQIKAIYFIGIGGIGMSALARYFNHLGKAVSGYDKTSTPLTSQLALEGIDIHFEDNIELISPDFEDLDAHESIVIYTPAIPEHHAELTYLKSSGYNVIKRSKALGIIVKNTKGLAVSGTHGKTTTSSILAHIIHDSGTAVSAFLGGIATNFNSNFSHTPGAELAVVEADEYDRSFLTLHPYGAIITSTDADHLDIYGEKDALLDSFKEFASQSSDVLVVHESIAAQLKYSGKAKLVTYGWNKDSDYTISSWKIKDGACHLNITSPFGLIKDIVFPMAGKHNSENALAALALGTEAGLDIRELASKLANFKGIKRRFETLLNTSNHVYIDDYAHHPKELNAAISAARTLHPTKKLTGIFQPHLFSRTQDFADDFAQSLSALDQVILLDIYPARELPIEGVTSAWLLEKIKSKSKVLLSKEETLQWIKEHKPELLLTLGAGDIDQLVNPITHILS